MRPATPARRGPARRIRFVRREDGAGTAFGLFGILVCLMFAGLSIDATNAWRNGEVLRLSADVAAHAGASRLAEEDGRMAALAVAAGATELNTPTAVYGRTIFDAYEDIEALHYDPATNMVSPSDTPNAVSVRLERSTRVMNPVPTYLLRLIGQDGWDLSVTSVAAVVPTERCDSGDGLYSHDAIVLGGAAVIGSDVCLHSQKSIHLPGQSSFGKNAWLSLPDMTRCSGGCSDMSTPGFAAASGELNLIMTTPDELIARLSRGFTTPGEELAEETAFFDRHPLPDDLAALDELGVKTEDLSTGDVVPLKPAQFDRARALPAGLVYTVACSGSGAAGRLLIGGVPSRMAGEDGAESAEDWVEGTDVAWMEGGGDGTDEALPAEDTGDEVVEGDEEARKLNGIVLVTDCLLHFTDLADIRGSVMISTRAVPGAAVTADAGASAGDPDLTCDPGMQTTILARGGMAVPARFTASNTGFVIGGEVTVEGEPAGGTALHQGLGLHAGGTLQMAGKHRFGACRTAITGLLPVLNLIKYVIPTEPLAGTN